MTDTPPDMQQECRRCTMARPAKERLRMAGSMDQTARTIAIASLPPDIPHAESPRLLFERFYPELARSPRRIADRR
jgi:hypothetical protein